MIRCCTMKVFIYVSYNFLEMVIKLPSCHFFYKQLEIVTEGIQLHMLVNGSQTSFILKRPFKRGMFL